MNEEQKYLKDCYFICEMEQSQKFDPFKILEISYKNVAIGINPVDELQLKWQDEEDYEELKHVLENILEYPSSDLADIHRDSNRMGYLDLAENSQIITKISFEQDSDMLHCNCCGFLFQNSEIPISTPFKRISNMGFSTLMYFETILSLSILLTINFFVYATYSFVTNVIASGKSTNEEARTIGLLQISMSPKQLNESDENIFYIFLQSWLGLITVVIWCFMLIVIKYIEKKEELRIQTDTKSASDFSVVIHGVPTSMTKDEMQKQLDEYYQRLEEKDKPKKIDRRFKIVKYNMAVPFYLTLDVLEKGPLKNTIQQANKMRDRIAGWILERRVSEQFSEPKDIRFKAYRDYCKLKRRIQKNYRQSANKIIKEIKQKTNLQPTTSAYITFESSYAKDLLCHLNVSNSLVDPKKAYFLCKNHEIFYIKRRDQEFEVVIRKAPEPEDIIWNNLGQTKPQVIMKKILTYFITAIILGISFAIIYFLSVQQNKSKENYYLSFIISISIAIINVILQQIMKVLTLVEREFTQTKHQTSLAIKSVLAQLANSIVLPCVVNYYIEDNLYLSNGLAYDVAIISLTNAFLVPLLKVFDIYYIFIRIMAWRSKQPVNKLFTTQLELNETNSYMVFEVGYEYIYLVNLFLFICFFVSLQPIIVVFGLFGYLAMYWSQKYSLLNRMRRPFPGNDLINTAMYQLIYLGPLCFSLGNLTWANLVPGGFPRKALVPNLIAVGISVVIVLLPYKRIFQFFFEDIYPEQILYENQRIFLPSQYDRLNPATAKQAVSQYVEYVKTFRQKLKEKTKEELLKIEEIFCAQQQRGQRKAPKILKIMSNFTNLKQILKTESSESEEQDQKQHGNANPFMIFRDLHVNSNRKIINFVQNWAHESKNNGNNDESTLLGNLMKPKNDAKKQLTFDTLKVLMGDIYSSNKIKSDQNQLSQNKIQPQKPKKQSPYGIFDQFLLQDNNKNNNNNNKSKQEARSSKQTIHE